MRAVPVAVPLALSRDPAKWPLRRDFRRCFCSDCLRFRSHLL